jgi:hypothetical protein
VRIIKLEVTGVGSLLMHNPAAMANTSDELQRSGKKIPKPYDEAKAGLYVLPDHQLYLKSDMFREAALIAARELKDITKRGRSNMTARFAASVFLSSDHCPLVRPDTGQLITDKDEDWEIDIRRVVVQKNGDALSSASPTPPKKLAGRAFWSATCRNDRAVAHCDHLERERQDAWCRRLPDRQKGPVRTLHRQAA